MTRTTFLSAVSAALLLLPAAVLLLIGFDPTAEELAGRRRARGLGVR